MRYQIINQIGQFSLTIVHTTLALFTLVNVTEINLIPVHFIKKKKLSPSTLMLATIKV